MVSSNGNHTAADAPLPPAREAIIDQAHRLHQEVAHHRDLLLQEVQQLKSDIAGYKVAIEAQATHLATMESRVASSTMARDQAVADRTVYEVLFVSIQSQLRAFSIPAAPLIKEVNDEANPDRGPDRPFK